MWSCNDAVTSLQPLAMGYSRKNTHPRRDGGSLSLEIWAGGGLEQSGKTSQNGDSKMLAIRCGCMYFFLE